MISNALIAKAAINTINKLGIGYRVGISEIKYISGDVGSKGSYDIKSRIDVKLYDSVIDQIASIQIDNLDMVDNNNNIDADDLPASVLEDYPEATIPANWINLAAPSEFDKNEVGDNLTQIIKKDDQLPITSERDSDTKTGFKVYEINTNEDGERIISDINELSYKSLCVIFEDVFKEMMAVTMFSLN